MVLGDIATYQKRTLNLRKINGVSFGRLGREKLVKTHGLKKKTEVIENGGRMLRRGEIFGGRCKAECERVFLKQANFWRSPKCRAISRSVNLEENVGKIEVW